MNQSDKTHLLEQIAAIPAMERGKLSPHSSGRHQKLQSWQAGRNHTRHVAAEELRGGQMGTVQLLRLDKWGNQYARDEMASDKLTEALLGFLLGQLPEKFKSRAE